MWYIAWILGTFLACAFSIITALTLEQFKENRSTKKNANEDYD